MTDTDEIADIPLPGMPPHEPPKLWAVHHQGSDEYIAAPDRGAAAAATAVFADLDANNAHRENYPRHNAVVVEWPFDAAGHAEALVAQEAEA